MAVWSRKPRLRVKASQRRRVSGAGPRPARRPAASAVRGDRRIQRARAALVVRTPKAAQATMAWMSTTHERSEMVRA
jgi:hypothetical protein